MRIFWIFGFIRKFRKRERCKRPYQVLRSYSVDGWWLECEYRTLVKWYSQGTLKYSKNTCLTAILSTTNPKEFPIQKNPVAVTKYKVQKVPKIKLAYVGIWALKIDDRNSGVWHSPKHHFHIQKTKYATGSTESSNRWSPSKWFKQLI